MATREELENLKTGDPILVDGEDAIFGCLKPKEAKKSPVIYWDKGDLISTWSADYDRVTVIKPTLKLYACRCLDDTEMKWFSSEEKADNYHPDWGRAPEFDLVF